MHLCLEWFVRMYLCRPRLIMVETRVHSQSAVWKCGSMNGVRDW